MNITFSKWVQYYRRNNQNLKYIHWDDNYKLTTNEREIIIKSIQQFQLGENSEGKYLIKRAQEYVHQTQDQDYYEALIEFIKEEQRHARDLGRFMKVQGIPLLRRHWVDNVFRILRRYASLEQSVIVLLTAEIIAKLYYKALQKSTNSEVLIDLCNQILSDEEKHVQFQSETLHKFAQNRNVFFNRIVYGARIKSGHPLTDGRIIRLTEVSTWENSGNDITKNSRNKRSNLFKSRRRHLEIWQKNSTFQKVRCTNG